MWGSKNAQIGADQSKYRAFTSDSLLGNVSKGDRRTHGRAPGRSESQLKADLAKKNLEAETKRKKRAEDKRRKTENARWKKARGIASDSKRSDKEKKKAIEGLGFFFRGGKAHKTRSWLG